MLSIAYGNSRISLSWSNKTVSFDDLCERLKSTTRTTESVEEYKKMTKAQKDFAKDKVRKRKRKSRVYGKRLRKRQARR